MSAFPYYPRSSLKRQARNRDLQDLIPFPNFFIFKKELPIICKCIFDGTDFLVVNTRDITTLYHNGAFGVSRLTLREPVAFKSDDSYKQQPYFQKAVFLTDELIVQSNFKVPKNPIVVSPLKSSVAVAAKQVETVSSNVNHGIESNEKNVNVQEENSSSTPSSKQPTDTEEDVLVLIPQEVIFLTFGVGCLSVQDVDGHILSHEVIWNMMVKKNPEFPILYAVYHYFRCKNWVPKNGHAFGGDYILYEYGPTFSHATYVVHIFGSSRPDPTWMELYARQRCAIHSTKLALLCRVSTPKNFVPSSPMSISMVNIQETTIHRWKP